MKLFNTLSRSIEDFHPIDSNFVRLYACGPTVYDYTHIGHLRKYVMDDVLVRVLRHAGYEVKFVRNVTDVGHLSSDSDTGEDKMEKGAKKYGTSVWDTAHKFEDYFNRSMDLIGNVRPNITSRVTDHIADQLVLVQKLEEKGFTYVIPGDGVYFDTSKFPRYADFARLDTEGFEEGARVEMVEGKRNATDFALWKFERPGENRAMVWESPWHPRSFPGWHIECSAIAMQHLGEQLDIHTGGIDHIPVHHTNEIAQSEAASGKYPFVRYWVHHNFLTVDGQKMSKSLNNFYTIDDLLKKDYEPMAFRLLLLSAHYRSAMNFTWETLEGSQVAWERLMDKIQTLLQEKGDSSEPTPEQQAKEDDFRKRFFSHLENDLHTPEALAVLWEMIGSNQVTSAQKYRMLLGFDEVFGLGLARMSLAEEEPLPEAVKDLLTLREKAREEKDWNQSDELRTRIEEAGFTVMDDSLSGQKVKKK